MVITQEIMEFDVIGMKPWCEVLLWKAQGKSRKEVSEEDQLGWEDHGKKRDQLCCWYFFETWFFNEIISLYGPLPQAQTCRLIALCQSITSEAGAVGQANYDGTAS